MRNNQYVPQFQVRTRIHSGDGGYVDGVWYPDRSGVCGGNVPLPNPPAPVPPTGGGYVGGVWYSDRSGVCG
jgi:hypothetical protein